MSISITVDPSGRFVYATIGTNPSTPTAVIAQFTIDQNTGALAAMTPPTVSAGGAGTAVITVEPQANTPTRPVARAAGAVAHRSVQD